MKLAKMAASTKLEFTVQMTCQNCADAVTKKLSAVEGIKVVHVDIPSELLVVETSLPSNHVKDLIESTNRRAVLMGMGSGYQQSNKSVTPLGAAVAMMSGQGAQGVTRLVQLDAKTCIVDGTMDGLSPGKHGLYIHELGDISNGCESCGEVLDLFEAQGSNKKLGDLGEVTADQRGRAEFRMKQDVNIGDIIGRSMIIHDFTKSQSGQRVACGIIARSAGLFQNPKRICTCDGVSVWEERDRPLVGEGRRAAASQL